MEAHRLLGLGVDDRQFVKSLYDALKPGGYVVIYNICPAPSPPGAPYKNWADGRCPFAEEVWKSVGFRVMAFDRDDSEGNPRDSPRLGLGQGRITDRSEKRPLAQYSLIEKPAHP